MRSTRDPHRASHRSRRGARPPTSAGPPDAGHSPRDLLRTRVGRGDNREMCAEESARSICSLCKHRQHDRHLVAPAAGEHRDVQRFAAWSRGPRGDRFDERMAEERCVQSERRVEIALMRERREDVRHARDFARLLRAVEPRAGREVV